MVNTPATPARRPSTRQSWIQHRRAPPRVGDNKINFFIYCEVDGDTSKHHLSASNYGPENVGAPHPCSVTISEMVCVYSRFLGGPARACQVFLTEFG